MIYFNGKCSEDFGLFVEKYPVRPVPERKYEKISIPGRNGDIIYPEEAYQNVIQQYEVYISAEERKLNNAAKKITQWLSVPGYKRLEDDYDPETYRMAAYLGGTEIENMLNEYGRATLAFDCCPQRFLKSGEHEINLTNGQKIINPTIFPALPIIEFSCYLNGTINVGNESVRVDYTGRITIDCEELECYTGTTRINDYMSGKFPKLTGETQITWGNGISNVKIIPRWFEI